MTSNPGLVEAILTEIRGTGGRGIPFATFMERALYHPEWGYYAGGTPRVGRAGDFFTSVSVGECFGMLLARHVMEARELVGSSSDGAFLIVEQGANDGSLARDVLGGLADLLSAEDFARVHYAIIEPFPRLRERQRLRLEGEFPGKVRHYAAPGDLAEKGGRGIFLCNELLDAFPVHRVVFEGGAWREIHVIARDGGFAEVSAPLSESRLCGALDGLVAAEGFRTEICLAAGDWMGEVARIFESGCISIIDYGLVEEAYFSPDRRNGTLRGYRNHRGVEDFLEETGGTDLTAHVNFTRLARAARSFGLEVVGFAEQGQFLVGQAEQWMMEVESAGAPDSRTAGLLRQFQTLIHPGMMGRSFQVLTFGKSLPGEAATRLSGFRHASGGVAALG